MKKLFFIVSLLALSLGCLTSCNDSEKPSADYEWDFNVSDIVLHVTSQEGITCWMPVLPEIFLKTISG